MVGTRRVITPEKTQSYDLPIQPPLMMASSIRLK